MVRRVPTPGHARACTGMHGHCRSLHDIAGRYNAHRAVLHATAAELTLDSAKFTTSSAAAAASDCTAAVPSGVSLRGLFVSLGIAHRRARA